jgi:class 3 adenylate cyclase/tetratricopeptide (TPR) repeat protein
LLGPATSQIEGERRYLTVMFCDLVGSTDLSERLDPEDFGEMVLAYQETGRQLVEDHGGQVAHYAGDGLLAFFGYPVAHEDDADRAVTAALAILTAMPDLTAHARRLGDVTLQARVGIHAGPIVIGAMGSSNRSDISLFGLTANVSARLQAFASPGAIVISDTAMRVLRGSYNFTELGTPDLKGVTQKLAAHQVHGIRIDRSASVSDTPRTMIGREAERHELIDSFATALELGTQSLLISGEPGVGKSTLVGSLRIHLEETPHVWLELQCSELAQASPLRPVIIGLRELLQITDGEPAQEQLAKLTVGLGQRGDAATAILPYLAELLAIERSGVPELEGLSGELRRARTLDALVEWAGVAASQSALVIVAEDLQWADPSTLELLHRLRGRGSDEPILVVGTSRVEAIAPGLFNEHDHVRLARLSIAESRSLATALSAKYEVPDDVLVQLADRGDGVPLFIEELIRDAAERASHHHEMLTQVPDTLQSLLASRLDRLGESRSVAQAASVIGREFPLDLLRVITDLSPDGLQRWLEVLVEAGIIARQAAAGEPTYVFRHALIHDAAYASLLRRTRREIHRVIASVLPDMRPTIVRTAPELVAHHHEAAGAALTAARWYADAGTRACERAAYVEGTSHYEAGIALLRKADLTTEAEELLLSLLIFCGNALMSTAGPGGEETLPMWEEAVALAQELGNLDELTSALNGVATYRSDRGQLDMTLEVATKILEISQQSGSRVAALRGHCSLSVANFYKGQVVLALTHAENALAAEREGDYFTVTYGIGHDQGSLARSMLAWSQWWLGRPDVALSTAQEGKRRADRLPSSITQAMANHMVAFIHYERGEANEAIAAARANIASAEQLNFQFWLGTSLLILGAQQACLGNEAGMDDLDRAFNLLLESGDRGGGGMAFALLAQAQLSLGRHEEALATAELGLTLSEASGQPFYDPELQRLAAMSRFALEPEAVDDANRALTASLTLARRMGAASFGLRAATDLAALPDSSGSRRARVIGELEVALAQMGDGETSSAQSLAHTLLNRLDPTRMLSASSTEKRRTT